MQIYLNQKGMHKERLTLTMVNLKQPIVLLKRLLCVNVKRKHT